MGRSVKLPKKQFYILVIALGVILLALSAEVMLRAKDTFLYEKWYQQAVAEGLETGIDESFSMYMSLNLSAYFMKVIVPMAMGVYTYFAYVRIRINRLFVFVWTVLLAGAAAYIAVGRDFTSVFYYIILAAYAVVIITVLSLINVINESKYT